MTAICIVLGLACLLIFLSLRDKDGSSGAAMVKSFASLFFIATALAAIAENQGGFRPDHLEPVLLIIMGLALGLVGDIMLDFKIVYQTNIKDSDTYTWTGMAVFGIGHILFIAAVAMLYGFSAPALLAGMLLNGVIFGISRWAMKMDFGKWYTPSLLYGFLLSIFMCQVIAACIRIRPLGAGLMFLLAGSVLFLLSDLVLSMTYFQAKDSKAMIVVNHLLYYFAQFAIAVSLKYTPVFLAS